MFLHVRNWVFKGWQNGKWDRISFKPLWVPLKQQYKRDWGEFWHSIYQTQMSAQSGRHLSLNKNKTYIHTYINKYFMYNKDQIPSGIPLARITLNFQGLSSWQTVPQEIRAIKAIPIRPGIFRYNPSAFFKKNALTSIPSSPLNLRLTRRRNGMDSSWTPGQNL